MGRKPKAKADKESKKASADQKQPVPVSGRKPLKQGFNPQLVQEALDFIREKAKLPNINNLKRLIGKCLDDGFHLTFYLPNQDLRNPTWDELQEHATEAYSLALQDVLAAINGNTESLGEGLVGGRQTIHQGR